MTSRLSHCVIPLHIALGVAWFQAVSRCLTRHTVSPKLTCKYGRKYGLGVERTKRVWAEVWAGN